MKRVLSGDDSGFNKRSKIIKIRDGLFEFFGLNKFDKEPVVFHDGNQSINSTANISTRPVITGNQLKDLYERSMRGDDAPLQSFLKTVNITNDVSMLESTKFNNESILQSLHSDKENGSSKSTEKVINHPKRKHSPDSSNVSITTATKFVKQPSGTKQIAPLRPTFSIDPLERARLIQLKKRMETDKVRKARLNFLRKHSQNLIQVKHAPNQKNPKYVDTAVETVSYSPDLATLSSNTGGIASKALKLNEIPEHKKNKTGWFVLDPYVSDDEEDNSNNDFGKIDQGKPLIDKIKFAPKKKNELGPNTAPPKFDTATKAKSFVPTKSDYAKAETKSEKPKATALPTHHVSLKSLDEEDTTSAMPTSAFVFGDTPSSSKPTSTSAVPSFSLSGDNSSQKEEAKKTFSFGTTTTPSFPPTTKKENSAPAPVKPFSFGGSNATEKKDEQKSLFSKSGDGTAPSFSVGGSKPALSLGSSSVASHKKDEKDEKKAVPTFSFGATTSKTNATSEPTKPSFGFGSSSTLTDETKKPEVPAFSFGSTSEKKDNAAPAISFGSSTTTEKKNTSSTPFTFGSSNTKSKSDSGQTIFLGSSEKKDESNKPSFSFDASTDKNEPAKVPSFSFGGASESKNDSVPKVSFGSAPTGKKDEPTPKPFSFGVPATTGGSAPSSNPTLSLDSTATAPIAEKKDGSSDKPTFNFGTTTSGNKDESAKAAFSLGPSASTSTSKPAFTGFGSASVEKKDEIAKPSFTFGGSNSNDATSSTTKPAFGGLGSTPANGFSFGTTTPSKDNDANEPNKKLGNPTSTFSLDASKVSASAFGENKVNNYNGAFSFGGSASSAPPSANDDTASQGAPLVRPKSTGAFGGSGFSFNSSSSAKPGFSFAGNNDTNKPASAGNNGAFGFGFGTGTAGASNGSGFGSSNNSSGFGANSNNKPSEFGTNTAQPQSGFGGFGGSQNNLNGSKPMFGGSNTNTINAESNNNSAFGFNGGAGSFSNPNSKESTPGFGAQPQQGKIFNFGSMPSIPQQPANPAFNFGGSSGAPTSHGFGGNQQQQAFNPSRSATPNFNFTGQQQTNLDPSSIFSNAPPSNGTPPPGGRRKLMPRSMRSGRR